MIADELKADILRFYYAEKWRIGTIARQLHVHKTTVRRILSQEGIPAKQLLQKPCRIDSFLPFIMETLGKYPKLSSTRLYYMACERGYNGHIRHFSHLISLYRPRPSAEAYLRLKTLPGEQGQIDWGHFGYLQIGKARRPLIAFVMVLSFSRKIFLRFYLNQRMGNFLRGHEAGFTFFGGVPRVLLYDNLSSAVTERHFDAIRFNGMLLKFSAHYRFEARPVAVARGNEKGRVERAIRYVRGSFFAGRTWKDLEDLNKQAYEWCEGIASERPCPEDKTLSVRAVFEAEKSFLLQLPNNPFSTEDREEVRIGKTPYARIDLNDYSVPHIYVQRTLTALLTEEHVRILADSEVIAIHKRSYDKGQQIEEPSHIERLIQFKRKARHHSNQNRLIHAVPSIQILLTKAAEKGFTLRSIIRHLSLLLDSYGATELEIAVVEALKANVPHSNAVRINLERYREARQLSTAIRLNLQDVKATQQVVKPHALSTYDELQQKEDLT